MGRRHYLCKAAGEKLASREILHAFIKSKLADDTALIVTDEHQAYLGIADKDTLHATVNHFQKEYVRGIVHTNTLGEDSSPLSPFALD